MATIKRNILSLLVTQVLTWVVSMALLIVVPSYLGDEGYGKLSYAATFVSFFALAASLGSLTLLTREVARDHSLAGPYVYNGVLLKLILVGVLSTLAFGLAYALGNRGEVLVLIAIQCLVMLFMTLNDVYVGALNGMERMATPAMWGVVQTYVGSALGVLVIILDLGLAAFALVIALAATIPVFFNRRAIVRTVGSHHRFQPRVWRFLVRAGLPLMLLSGLNMIYGTIDIPILDHISGSATVGWYTVAYRWAGIPIFIVTAASAAYLPRFSAHGRHEDEEFAPLVNQAVRLVLLVSIPAAIGVALCAENLITDFYKPEFEPAIVLTQILSIHIPIAAMDTILASALIAADRQNRYLVVAGIAAVLTPIASVFAIRLTEEAHGNGAIGAAIVTVSTELLVMIGALLLKSKGVMDRAAITSAVRILLAGAAMVPVLLAVQDAPLLVKVVLGALVYGVAALLFRAVRWYELRRVWDGIRRAVAERRRPPVPDSP